MTSTSADQPPILLASLISLLVATLILVTLVLPAEYDLDPLGTGEMLGLRGLSETAPAALQINELPLSSDSVSYTLGSFESVEYKFRLAAGAGMVFSWSATGDVTFDLHAEPDGAEEGFAESFSKGRSNGESGSYTAPFSGLHGWFWENRGVEPVTVTFRGTGFYPFVNEYRDGFVTEKRFDQESSGSDLESAAEKSTLEQTTEQGREGEQP